MGKQLKQNSLPDTQHFDDPDWSLVRALGWATLPTKENVEAAARGFGSVSRQAATKLTVALRLARRGLAATGLFEGEKFARKIDPELWSSLEIKFERKSFLGRVYFSAGDNRTRSSTLRLITVRSKIAQRQSDGIHQGHHAMIRGVTVPRAVLMRVFPARAELLNARAATRCYDYLFRLMDENPDHPPKKKLDLWADCKARFSGLSRRAFDRKWAEAIDKTSAKWDNAGRPKKTQH